jgi:transcriptional antiterminator NusG
MENQVEFASIDAVDSSVGCGKTFEVPVIFRESPVKRKFEAVLSIDFNQVDKLVEWFISVQDQKNKSVTTSPLDKKDLSVDVELGENESRKIVFVISTPRGGYIGDSASVTIQIKSDDGILSLSKTFKLTLAPVIIALKTMVGNELSVSIDLERKSNRDMEERRMNDPNAINEVFSMLSPYEVKGYVFAEVMHPDRVSFISKGIKGFKGVVSGNIDLEEIAHYLIPKPAVSGLELGAFVELIDGPFKGEKAKIMSIDSNKEEVTVQLVESMVPIPVTVKAEAIRMLDIK